MNVQKILLPYNHTPHDRKALNFVIDTFSKRGDVQVTLINIYAPLPQIDMASSPEMAKIRDRLTSLQEEIQGRESALETTRIFLLQKGFREDQVDYIFKERKQSIPDEILSAAQKGHYDVIVLSAKDRGRVTQMLSRSVHERLLGRVAGVTICIAK